MFIHTEANQPLKRHPKLLKNKQGYRGQMLLSAHKQANTSIGTRASEHLSELNRYEFSQQTFIQIPALCQLLEYLVFRVMVLTYRPMRMRPQQLTYCDISPVLYYRKTLMLPIF